MRILSWRDTGFSLLLLLLFLLLLLLLLLLLFVERVKFSISGQELMSHLVHLRKKGGRGLVFGEIVFQRRSR